MDIAQKTQQSLSQTIIFRSLIFYCGYALFIAFYGIFILPIAIVLPMRLRHPILNIWPHFVVWWAKIACGVCYTIEGLNNLTVNNGVVLCKHQSIWETFFLQKIFTPQSTAIKKELLWIPFFGWGISLVKPIVIDRKQKTNALKQMIKQGKERLKEGNWVVIYPEGTRVEPGSSIPFTAGGTLLASQAGASIIPVAHNAGECWPARSWLLFPGLITVCIGPVINTQDRKPKEITQEVQNWIEVKMAEISEIERRSKPN